MNETKEIKLSAKKNYSIFQKIFCLRCFGCMKSDNNSLLTADNRKQVIQKMLAKSLDTMEVRVPLSSSIRRRPSWTLFS